MVSTDPPPPPPPSRLENFPISFFAVTMGVFGLAFALLEGGFDLPATGVGVAGVSILMVLFVTLALKALRFPASLKAEWAHPVRLAFFPATSVSLLLMATVLRDAAPELAEGVWLVGAATHGVLTLVVISAWIGHRAFGPGQLSPAWFIPAVGNLAAPLGGVAFGYVELSWYFFAVGVLFWIVLLTLVFNRLIFHDPLPGKLKPTIVILIAPPALAFLAWVQFQGGVVDAPARILINLGYFFTALVAIQIPSLLKLPFALSFWALSFPLAAIATASFRFADLTGSVLHQSAGFLLLGMLIITIAVLAIRTVRAAMAGEVFRPD
ncbi:MAG: SLAC1 anion channel family protein [Roseicyclus sp.]|nr:SLAC1 anion channel family protein [Roseicyclus sp.]